MKEIYVSIDIEADGPIPGANSMLNFGAAAFDLGADNPLVPIATWEANLKPLEWAEPDPGTMAWWRKKPEAWNYVTKEPGDPDEVMPMFCDWLRQLPGNPVMVTYPSYDFMWLHWYIMRFGALKSPFSFSSLDIKTLAMVALGHDSFKGTSKRLMSKRRKEWFADQPPHDHTGLSDAIGQGMLFVHIMQELQTVRERDRQVAEVLFQKQWGDGDFCEECREDSGYGHTVGCSWTRVLKEAGLTGGLK